MNAPPHRFRLAAEIPLAVAWSLPGVLEKLVGEGAAGRDASAVEIDLPVRAR